MNIKVSNVQVKKKDTKIKMVVVLSGGLDSTTLLYKAIKRQGGAEYVKAISFDYGQRHRRELDMAAKTCKVLGVDHKIVDLSCLKDILKGSALTDDIEVPEGHYEDANMKATVVPNRNMIMASIAIGYAVSLDFDVIALGVHAGDHAIYPDCRPEFIGALAHLSNMANYKRVGMYCPYLFSNKGEIIKDGIDLGVDYSLTLTCYNGQEKACGKCGSCQERLEAFELNEIKDPINYS